MYIVEHRNCGAYRAFLNDGVDYEDMPDGDTKEYRDHEEWAFKLMAEIKDWYAGWYAEWFKRWKKNHPGCDESEAKKEYPDKLDVRCFLMDLRGNIDCLNPSPPSPLPVLSAPPKVGPPVKRGRVKGSKAKPKSE